MVSAGDFVLLCYNSEAVKRLSEPEKGVREIPCLYLLLAKEPAKRRQAVRLLQRLREGL
jgi:hypothetical protein